MRQFSRHPACALPCPAAVSRPRMKDTLEDLEQYIIDVIIHNRRGLRASMCRSVFWFLSGIYKGAVKAVAKNASRLRYVLNLGGKYTLRISSLGGVAIVDSLVVAYIEYAPQVHHSSPTPILELL